MKAQNDVRVTIRVDKDLKDRADMLFDRLGLNMTTALNVFLRKAVDEEGIPFPVSAKGSSFGVGLTSADITKAFELAVQNETAETRQKGLPVGRYDVSSKKAYLEFPDGTREYVDGQ